MTEGGTGLKNNRPRMRLRLTAAFLLLGLLLLAAAGLPLLGDNRYTGHPLYGVEGGNALSEQVWILDDPQLRYIGTAGCWVRLQLCNPCYLSWEEGKLVRQYAYRMEYQRAAGFNQAAWDYREGWFYYRFPVYPDPQGDCLDCLYDRLTCNPAVSSAEEKVSVLIRVEFAPLSQGDQAAQAFAGIQER